MLSASPKGHPRRNAEELKILRTKSAETLKVIAKIKAVFGLDAKVTQ